MYIFPYNAQSGSVRALRAAMEELRIIRRENSKFRGDETKTVINWGCTQLPEEVMKANVINNPEAVAVAANKKLFFDTVKGAVNIPDYTDDKVVALSWLKDGKTVLAREKLNGHSGDGIVVLTNEVEWGEYDHDKSKIYVKYIPKKDEYRIHVSNGEVIDMQRKAIRRDTPAAHVNWEIRNHDNGFIFVREGVEPPQQVLDQAKLAVKATGLDFGAVDIIWNNLQEKAYVLEINTAPGLEGQSVETYKKSLKELLAEVGRAQERVALRGRAVRTPVWEAAVPAGIYQAENFPEPLDNFEL